MRQSVMLFVRQLVAPSVCHLDAPEWTRENV
jgi:hypothetical protein